MNELIIGANIRVLRESKGRTLTEVARASRLTKSGLSKIENGIISPPIATLLRIASALGVPVAKFFEIEEKDPPFVLTRRGQGKIITQDGSRFGYAYEALALEKQHKLAEPFMLTIQPGDPAGKFRHGGEEFIYMLAGRLRFTVGDQPLILLPGDSLYFDPQEVHSTKVLGRTPVRFLCFFVQQRYHNLTPRRRN